jgi:hypothetical protein
MRRLTSEQIDRAVSVLRSRDAEYVIIGGTGLLGGGYAHRGGTLYIVEVSDDLQGPFEVPVTESELRRHLASLDLDQAGPSDGVYRVRALHEMGIDP